MIKALLVSIIISFFFIYCLRIIDQSAANALAMAEHSAGINYLNNLSVNDPGFDGFRIVNGDGNLVTCKPLLVNNHAGRVCVAS
ncbi:hypothetical protein GF352_00105 [archaeon]|nr:hypothetical protein [archaeon]